MKYKILYALLLCFLLSNQIQAQLYADTKKTTKSFKLTPSTSVDINNKYGKIHLVTWDKDSIKIEISLEIRAKTLAKFDKIKNDIKFDITKTQYFITAYTEFSSQYNNSLLANIKDITDNLSPNDYGVQIDYKVYVPKWVNITIQNKYGNVFIDDLSGNVKLKLSNGNAKVNNLMGESDIEIKFGAGSFNTLTQSKISTLFSELTINKADYIELQSKSSEINIEQVTKLKMISARRNEINITNVNKISGESTFTNFVIDKLNNELRCDFKYGKMDINHISNSFSSLNFNGKFSDFKLFFESGSSYQLHIDHKNSIVDFPTEYGKIQRKVINSDEKRYLTYGNIGGVGANKQVKIIIEGGSIKIIHK